jgi:hypothetical protein
MPIPDCCRRVGLGAGSPYWSPVWLLAQVYASASPRSVIVFNVRGWLSRRERCLDNHPRTLRAAWIGVMQKEWMRRTKAARFDQSLGGLVTPRLGARSCSSGGCGVVAGLGSRSSSSGRCGVMRRLRPWPSSLVPGRRCCPDLSGRPDTLDQARHTNASCQTNGSGHAQSRSPNRTRRTNRSGLPGPRRTRPHPPDEREQAPKRGVTSSQGTCQTWRPSSFLIHSFCLTPILAAFNGFGGLSRHLSRLDKPPKPLQTIRDRGEAEAQNARPSQTDDNKATHHPTATQKINSAEALRLAKSPGKVDDHQPQQKRPSREFAEPQADPRPNPGGYGPFPIYPCQAPNG